MWSSRPRIAREGGTGKRTLLLKNYLLLGSAERSVLKEILLDTISIHGISIPGLVRSSIVSFGPKYNQGLKDGFYMVFNDNLATSDATSDAIQYILTRLRRYPRIRVDEIPYTEEHEHTVCYFPDPWIHPTPWDIYVQDNFQDVELINKILRRRPEVSIGCFLANGQLGQTQCLPMSQSNSTSCQKHFEDIYRAMEVAQHLPGSQQKLVHSFCLHYIQPCVHELKSLVMVAIYLNFPSIMGRDPDMEEVREASRLLTGYDENNQVNWAVCIDLLNHFINLNIMLAGFCYRADLHSNASKHLAKAKLLLSSMPEDTLKCDLRTSLQKFGDKLSTGHVETRMIAGAISRVISDTQMTISPGWGESLMVDSVSFPVFMDGLRLDSLMGIRPSTHLVTCEYNDDDVIVKVNICIDPTLDVQEEQNEEEQENGVSGQRDLQTIMEEDEISEEDNIFLSNPTAVLNLSDSEDEEREVVRYQEITDGKKHKWICFSCEHVHNLENCLLEFWIKKMFDNFVNTHFPNQSSKARVKENANELLTKYGATFKSFITNQGTKEYIKAKIDPDSNISSNLLDAFCEGFTRSGAEDNVFIFSIDTNDRNILDKIIKIEHKKSAIIDVDSDDSDSDEDDILASGG